MEKQFPKNVRQIGNVSDNPKIYIEDYVDTFFNQLCARVEEFPLGAFLIGETAKVNEQDCIFVHGAVQLQAIEKRGMDIVLENDVLKVAYEQSKEYFGEFEVLGWFLAVSENSIEIDKNLIHLHEKIFPKEHSILIVKDAVEKEELHYAYKYKDLMQLGGHYIYYEKNPSMQNYMIATRKQNCVTPSEVVEDRAAKDFRTHIRGKIQHAEQKQNGKFVYVTSAFLILVVLVIGITTMNNYDKMQMVQKTLENIAQTVSKENDHPVTRESSGTVIADTSQTAPESEPVPPKEENVVQQEPASTQESSTKETSQGAESGDGCYVVQKGDTLAKISKKAYGDIAHVDVICKMNGLKDGNLIYIGQELLLP
ncbi:MAG: LysM peptidoglycan-binding domain-containing protein [Lachnospiraceae bacterium]